MAKKAQQKLTPPTVKPINIPKSAIETVKNNPYAQKFIKPLTDVTDS